MLLLVVMLPPATALVWLGLRLLQQDRGFLVQRAAERREAAAEVATRTLLQLLAEAERGALPRGVVRAHLAADGARIDPPSAIAWSPAPILLPEYSSTPFLSAEADEFRNRGDRGRARYAAMADAPHHGTRAGALLRLARLDRREAKWGAAVRQYRRLARLPDVAINRTPADLLARRMIIGVLREAGRGDECLHEAQAVWNDLRAGRWSLDRSAWHLAAADVHTCYPARAGSAEQEALSASLDVIRAEHAAALHAGRGQRVIFAQGVPTTIIWRGDERSVDVVALAVSAPASALQQMQAAISGELAVTLFSDDGRYVAGGLGGNTAAGLGLTPHAPGNAALIRQPGETALPWVMRVETISSIGIEAELVPRRRLLAAGLVSLVSLLCGGSYLLWRVVQRELAVARLKTEFVAAVSHEFRTPLTSLRHVTELLQEDDEMPRERRQAFYAALAGSGERLHRLVESVLDFARMDEGRRTWQRRPTDLVDLVQGTLSQFGREHPDRRIVLECASTLPPVNVEPAAISQALWNLLDNAVKYSPPATSIELTLDTWSGGAEVSVTDHGLGIPASERSAIFARFVRGGEAMRRGIKGTGLGLAIVTQIIEAHGGELRLASEEGAGSTFTIVLPTPSAAAAAR